MVCFQYVVFTQGRYLFKGATSSLCESAGLLPSEVVYLIVDLTWLYAYELAHLQRNVAYGHGPTLGRKTLALYRDSALYLFEPAPGPIGFTID